MRTFTSILIAAFYLATSLGITVNFHYCQGEISSVKIYSEKGKCCCFESEEDMDGCCDDNSFYYQLDDVQISSQIVDLDEDYNEFVVYPEMTVSQKFIDDELQDLIIRQDLPPPYKEEIFLLNCALTYYG